MRRRGTGDTATHPVGAALSPARRAALAGGAVLVAATLALAVPGNPLFELRRASGLGMALSHTGVSLLALGAWPWIRRALDRPPSVARALLATVTRPGAVLVAFAAAWPRYAHQLLTREWGLIEPRAWRGSGGRGRSPRRRRPRGPGRSPPAAPRFAAVGALVVVLGALWRWGRVLVAELASPAAVPLLPAALCLALAQAVDIDDRAVAGSSVALGVLEEPLELLAVVCLVLALALKRAGARSRPATGAHAAPACGVRSGEGGAPR